MATSKKAVKTAPKVITIKLSAKDTKLLAEIEKSLKTAPGASAPNNSDLCAAFEKYGSILNLIASVWPGKKVRMGLKIFVQAIETNCSGLEEKRKR